MNRFSLTLFVSAIVIISTSCDNDTNNDNLKLENGIIMYMAPPDNCNDYVIKTDDNLFYKPSDLSKDYKIDSLSIKFSFDSTDALHNCGFGGSIPIIDLTHIEKH